MADWYYAKEGRQHGPVSSSQLRQLAQSGQLLPDDLVFREGSSNWVAASTVSGLFPSGGAVAARTAAPSRSESAGGGFAFDEGGDEDAPVRSPGRAGRGGNYWGDVIKFRRFIAPFVIIVLFWLAVVLAFIAGLVYAGIGVFTAIRANALLGIGFILLALIAVPLYILAARMYAEIGLVLFRIYETLLDIKELQEKQRKT